MTNTSNTPTTSSSRAEQGTVRLEEVGALIKRKLGDERAQSFLHATQDIDGAEIERLLSACAHRQAVQLAAPALAPPVPSEENLATHQLSAAEIEALMAQERHRRRRVSARRPLITGDEGAGQQADDDQPDLLTSLDEMGDDELDAVLAMISEQLTADQLSSRLAGGAAVVSEEEARVRGQMTPPLRPGQPIAPLHEAPLASSIELPRPTSSARPDDAQIASPRPRPAATTPAPPLPLPIMIAAVLAVLTALLLVVGMMR